jgi:hypothetical protein
MNRVDDWTGLQDIRENGQELKYVSRLKQENPRQNVKARSFIMQVPHHVSEMYL